MGDTDPGSHIEVGPKFTDLSPLITSKGLLFIERQVMFMNLGKLFTDIGMVIGGLEYLHRGEIKDAEGFDDFIWRLMRNLDTIRRAAMKGEPDRPDALWLDPEEERCLDPLTMKGHPAIQEFLARVARDSR